MRVGAGRDAASRKRRKRSDSAIEERFDDASAARIRSGTSESLLPIRASEIDFGVARMLARWNFQQRNFVDDGRARCAGACAKSSPMQTHAGARCGQKLSRNPFVMRVSYTAHDRVRRRRKARRRSCTTPMRGASTA
jgi:hypothetical protein